MSYAPDGSRHSEIRTPLQDILQNFRVHGVETASVAVAALLPTFTRVSAQLRGRPVSRGNVAHTPICRTRNYIPRTNEVNFLYIVLIAFGNS